MKAIHVNGVGQPVAGHSPVLEQGEILAAVFECGFEEGGDVSLRDAPLLFARQERLEIQEPAQRLSGIVAAPASVELAVVSAIGVDFRLEPRAGLGVADVVPLAATHEEGNVGVVRALQGEIADVFDPAVLLGGFILAVGGGNRNDSFDGESIVKADVGVFGVVLQTIEEGGGGRSFSTARMSHQGDARHIHLAVEGIGRGLVPLAPELQMFEQKPSAHGLLLGRIVEQSAVQKIFIHGGEDKAAARQQFAEIGVAGVREIAHIMIAMDNERQREWAGAVGIPHAGIQRKLVQIEAPILPACPTLPSAEVLEEIRGAGGARFDFCGGAVLGAANVVAQGIEEFFDAIRTVFRRIRRGKFCGHGIRRRTPGKNLFHGAFMDEEPHEENIGCHGEQAEHRGDDFLA